MSEGTPSSHVLVVEDEPTIRQAVVDRLRAEGFTVTEAADGPSAVSAFEAGSPDAVLLDLMLPGFDGLEVCRRIQSARPVPVLMLTARDDETDLLVGLGVGADDYMTKPFSMREVVARLRALLRRVERAERLARTTGRLDLAGLVVDPATRGVTVDGTAVHLTPLEFDLLCALATEPGTVRSREVLMREVWGWGDATGTRTLDSHVKSLRAKIGAERVRTVHGVGYALQVPA
ncbi:response regulator transcription factor [Phycicoccus sp. BSK3Z-2]|uniref:Response regulator transcription factor n=1 Tax=Phycicoccus avicenniae TaxID=2828860 RepID=A0A941HZQ0_9MICO|nr:response regulator transcription factor [Phycicoccus avicenniae]MBR7743212.1 response regulator transcription factor [Phycicoccus avicenniae]